MKTKFYYGKVTNLTTKKKEYELSVKIFGLSDNEIFNLQKIALKHGFDVYTEAHFNGSYIQIFRYYPIDKNLSDIQLNFYQKVKKLLNKLN